MSILPRVRISLISLVVLSYPLWAADADDRFQEQARQILEETGVKGGLVVHIDCGGGKLTAALCAGDSYVVHGLDCNEDQVQRARRHIQSLGIYGSVAVERFDGKHLPYVDNLVNLVVSDDASEVAQDEIMRVLCPRGVAYIKQGARWAKRIKSLPRDIDEWTHYLHDASGNAVAQDSIVGPPRHMQWIAGPRHTRSHEHTPSINALVSAGGRIFYIADQASVASIRQLPQWYLVARDAYNGTLLWRRRIPAWFPHLVNWGHAPPHLQRRLIAVGDRVFVTLGLHAPLSALDAATGNIWKVYKNTQGAEEVIFHQGVLILVVRTVTDERRSELVRWATLSQDKHSPLYARESAQPLVSRLRETEAKADVSILAMEADTGRLLWKKGENEVAGLRALSLCAEQDRVFYQKGKSLVCVDLRSGREHWSSRAGPLRLVCGGRVVCADGQAMTVLAAKTGAIQWTQTPLLCDIRDVFVVRESLWLGGFKPFPKKRGPSWGPYFVTQRDLATGEVLTHIECENPGHHHRCYRNKATGRYILAGRRGTEFIDLASGEVREHSWARGVCKYGVMPCNGLLYTPPHACACYVGTKLSGFCALVSTSRAGEASRARPAEEPLQRGPGYQEEPAEPKSQDEGSREWSTYRCDAARSGFTRATVAAQLEQVWRRNLGTNVSSPVVADGKVFVASIDAHVVQALDADSGELQWSYTANGRVDSPPTVFANRVIFGCRDGSVYCLRASDGVLVWRFRGATAQRIMACGQLESALPVHGSVLVQGRVVFFTAGRSSYVDGGIDLYRVDRDTGRILSRTRVYSPDPETGRQPSQFAPYAMPGVRSDILVGDGEHVYLRDMAFDVQGRQQPQSQPHLIALTDFLDDAWAHRSYWMFGTRISVATGCGRQEKNLVYGRLMVFDDATIYGYGRGKIHWSNQFEDSGYRLFARGRSDGKTRWEKPVNSNVRAMALAGETLLVAGSPIIRDRGPDVSDETHGGSLFTIDVSNGAILGQHRLEAAPVFDAMAVVANRLYLTLENGNVVCMGERDQ